METTQSLSPEELRFPPSGARPEFPSRGLTSHFSAQHRNIAKVVSQVHAFQENPYTFAPDPKLQSCLKQRIALFSGADVSLLATDSRASCHQVASEKHSRKIQDKLRRMKATLQ